MNSISLDIYNQVASRFLTKLFSVQSNTSATCAITIENISILNSSDNCNISLVNNCISNSSTAVSLLYESLAEVLQIMDEYNRKKIEDKLNITLDEIKNNDNTGIIATCRAFAQVNASIDIGELRIFNCRSNTPLSFVFINSGSVEANCGLSEINRSLLDDNITQQYKFETINDISLLQFLFIIAMCFGIIMLSASIYILLKPRYSINTTTTSML